MDITSLKQQATTIRDERDRSANSATRVGRALLDTVNAIEENATNIDTNKANIASNKSAIAKLQAFYHGDLGNYYSWTEATARLDLMATDSSVNGQYQISVGAIPFIVNFVLLNSSAQIFFQSIIGSARIGSDGTLTTTHGIAVNIFSRTYASGQWGAWTRLAAVSEVPTPQTACAGTNKNYIYQDVKDSKKYVLTGVGKAFQNGGILKLSYKLWGCDNYGYDDGMSKTVYFPQVTSGADGAMSHSVYGRLLNHSIYEGPSTKTAVHINYTNFTEAGNKTFSIGAATTAKAGCMTVAHVNALNSLSSHIVDLGDFANEDEALKKIGELGICNNRNLVHAHLTYNAENSSAKTTLILIQSVEGSKCRQYIFNKRQVYTRLIHFTDESLSEHEFTEDFTFMFPDRLVWSDSQHGYLMSQFGSDPFGKDYTDPIPLATSTAAGLMSKEDYALLQKIKSQLNL